MGVMAGCLVVVSVVSMLAYPVWQFAWSVG